MDFKYIFSPLDINNINKSYKMVKADAIEPKTWMEFVKEVRDKNPGMALKDILRLASKLRGKSSSGKSSSGKSSSGNSSSSKSSSGNSGKKQKKRGGTMIFPILGGAPQDIQPPAEEGQVAAPVAAPVAAEEGQVAAPVAEQVEAPVAAPVAAAPSIPEDTDVTGGRGRKSNKSQKKSRKSKKSQKKSRKSKSKSKKTKRRH
jgi:hypothetical protein